MDLMQIRRMLMSVIGGAEMVGEFSKYEKVMKAGESNEARLLITHSLGVVPKLVIISCADTDVPYTTPAYIRSAVFTPSCGGANTVNASAVENSVGFIPAETLANGKYNLSSTEANFYQGNSGYKWSKNTTYTVELYA